MYAVQILFLVEHILVYKNQRAFSYARRCDLIRKFWFTPKFPFSNRDDASFLAGSLISTTDYAPQKGMAVKKGTIYIKSCQLEACIMSEIPKVAC